MHTSFYFYRLNIRKFCYEGEQKKVQMDILNHKQDRKKQNKNDPLSKLLTSMIIENPERNLQTTKIENLSIRPKSKTEDSNLALETVISTMLITKENDDILKNTRRTNKSVVKRKFVSSTTYNSKKLFIKSNLTHPLETDRLGKFSALENDTKTKLSHMLWEKLESSELNLFFLHPPSNYFKKTIMLTQAGRLWKFPINNEQNSNSLDNASFSEHFFLNERLDWCPSKGPIRRFMDLVIGGLTNNPYLGVNDKLQHLSFYENYFGSKIKVTNDHK